MNEEILFEGRFLRIVKRERWEFAARSKGSGVVGIVATTQDGKLILIEQHRLPVDSRVIELPAGLVGDEGDAGEATELAAMRELMEETGYEGTTMELLTTGPSSAGLTSEIVPLYLAENVQLTTGGGGVGGEEIVVHAIPLESVDQWLSEVNAGETLIDFKVYAALFFLRQRGFFEP